MFFFFFSSRRRHTRYWRDWSSDVCSSDLPQRQTLLFSATYPEGIAKLAARFMRDPVTVKVAAQHSGEQIEQRWYEVDKEERLPSVARLLEHFRPESTLAFCNTKARCRALAELLQAQGYSALELHGDLEQRDRDQVLVRFVNGSCSVLVATDVAGRGQIGRGACRGR